MNNVSIVGRTAKEVELRYTPNGKAVATTTVAVQRNYKNQAGEYEADFPQVVIWGKRAEALANHVKKGDRIGFTGRISTRSYDLKDEQGNPTGKKGYVTEIIAEDFDFLQDKPKQA